MIHPDDAERILTSFTDADLSIIDEVLYFDGWTSYEECGGVLIFRGIDGSLQVVEYGYSVMAEDNSNPFTPREITEAEMIHLMYEFSEAQDRIEC